MIPFTEDILASGHMGCIVRLAEVIARLQMVDHQKTFIKTLQETLHIPAENVLELSLVKLIITMTTYEVFFKIEEEVTVTEKEEGGGAVEAPLPPSRDLENDLLNYHGLCLLKSCMEFEKARVTACSFLMLSTDEVFLLASHPSGSFIVESFLKNKNIKGNLVFLH